MENEDITVDSFYHGEVTILQPRKGYRFSVDSPILADFLPDKPKEKALEVGTGAGIISLLALYRDKFASISAVEAQERLARLAEINAQKNGFSRRFQVTHGDFNALYLGYRGIKEIFANPPFQPLGRGRLSPDPEIRDAKFETRLTLGQLLERSYALLGEGGSLYLVLPYSRYDELLTLAEKTGFFPAVTRLVFPFFDGKPDRFLIQLTNRRVSPVDLNPLVIFKEPGKYSEEMDAIFSGRTKK